MFTMNRMTDYGTAVMVLFAGDPRQPLTTGTIAERLPLPYPTVRKLLKSLSEAGLLTSRRGPAGGYHLSRPPGEISLANVVEALEGPIALTWCSTHACDCALVHTCGSKQHWQGLNGQLRALLEGTTLAQMVDAGHAVEAVRPRRESS